MHVPVVVAMLAFFVLIGCWAHGLPDDLFVEKDR